MNTLTGYQKELINTLVESKALTFGEFTLKSGRISPYFVNMGRAISNGIHLNRVALSYCEKLIDTFGEDYTFIFGPAYKGIPLASSIAQALWRNYDINVRWGYDRKEAKGYGDARDKVLVGDLRDGDTVVMVDDVLTTGDTKIEVWDKLTGLASDIACGGVLVAVDRQEVDRSGRRPAEELSAHGVELHSIVTITDVFDHLHETEIHGERVIGDALYDMFQEYNETYGY
jgi:orotate phosphoribosyltransferase